MTHQEPAATEPSAAHWISVLSKYRDPNVARSTFEIVVTAVPFVALWLLIWAAWEFGFGWLSLLLSLPAAGFLLRLFMIQHDCGHGSFFKNRQANDWVGRVIGVLTLTPYDAWKRAHNIHHGTSGNLDKRGVGDLDTLTVREYEALPWLGRMRYRLYRNPLVLFGIGPIYMFVLRHRLPLGDTIRHWRAWISPMATNLALAAVIVALMYVVGVKAFLLTQIPITLIAGSIGIWLFFIQHQFDETFWAQSESWNIHDAALRGSSYYVMPKPLAWITAHIGIHHVHHLYARIPFYRLPQVMREQVRLAQASRVNLLESFACARLALWDEAQTKLVSFREARRLRKQAA
ncbi:MAG TPA: fatty acid desaturase [Rhizomicrobium sp.]|nr:fatty acid desaturase [Rhizomicrobium sp.]